MSDKENSGRSIWELIAVLAVIGLFFITVVKSYNKAVTKAKADAQERQIATLAKEAQIKMLGNTSLTPVTVKADDTEYMIGKGKEGPAKDYFGVKVKTTDKALCEELTDTTFLSPALITVNGKKEGECPGDIVFYFPKAPSNTAPLAEGDESFFDEENGADDGSDSSNTSGDSGNSGTSEGSGETTPTPSDYDGDEDGCTGNNFTYCSNGSCVSTADDCPQPEDFEDDEEGCENARFNWCSGASTPTCQADCCAGFSENACQTACDTETGEITNKTNGTVCPGGVCEAGVCSTCAINPETDCLSKALVEGECACAPAADEAECTSWTNNECGQGKYCVFNPSGCGDNDHGTGTCQPVSYIGDYSSATIAGHEYTMSMCENCPDWWSAQSWCKAHGKTMVSLSDVHCTSSGCTDKLWQDLGNALYQESAWTTDMYDSCYAFGVGLANGGVAINPGGGRRSHYAFEVLCE